MKIFIKQNEIITEQFYTDEYILYLIELGFQSVEIPEDGKFIDLYKVEDFEYIDNVWILKINKTEELDNTIQ